MHLRPDDAGEPFRRCSAGFVLRRRRTVERLSAVVIHDDVVGPNATQAVEESEDDVAATGRGRYELRAVDHGAQQLHGDAAGSLDFLADLPADVLDHQHCGDGDEHHHQRCHQRIDAKSQAQCRHGRLESAEIRALAMAGSKAL